MANLDIFRSPGDKTQHEQVYGDSSRVEVLGTYALAFTPANPDIRSRGVAFPDGFLTVGTGPDAIKILLREEE
jgi:hypothetical protein